MKPRGRAGVVALCAVVVLLELSAGCALIVGRDLGDHAVDAGHEAADVAARETGRGMDGSGPEGGDATDAKDVADAGDAGDAGRKDATMLADSGRDAGYDVRRIGFCASVHVPPGASVFCDDFDEEDGGPDLGNVIQRGDPTATLLIATDASTSPPCSLEMSAAPPGDGGATISWVYPIAPGSSYTLDFDVLVASTLPAEAGDDTTQLLDLGFITEGGASSALGVVVFPGNGGSAIGLFQNSVVDGGTLHTARSSARQGWRHVKLSLGMSSDLSVRDALFVDDASVENVPLTGLEPTADSNVQIGFHFVRGAGARRIYVDNLLVTSEGYTP